MYKRQAQEILSRDVVPAGRPARIVARANPPAPGRSRCRSRPAAGAAPPTAVGRGARHPAGAEIVIAVGCAFRAGASARFEGFRRYQVVLGAAPPYRVRGRG